MTDAVEEKKLRHDEGLDQHDSAGNDDGDEGYDIYYADSIEDDVARPSQRALEKRHSLI